MIVSAWLWCARDYSKLVMVFIREVYTAPLFKGYGSNYVAWVVEFDDSEVDIPKIYSMIGNIATEWKVFASLAKHKLQSPTIKMVYARNLETVAKLLELRDGLWHNISVKPLLDSVEPLLSAIDARIRNTVEEMSQQEIYLPPEQVSLTNHYYGGDAYNDSAISTSKRQSTMANNKGNQKSTKHLMEKHTKSIWDHLG